ncbi:MAG TPA: hypothetical protein VMM78_11550 [Thermomicrobiales bacterium]|nr:hypothetical protein [Thermomicrobiales bacterium]
MRIPIVIVALLGAALFLVSPLPALACSCVEQSLDEMRDRADYVFEGTVVGVAPNDDDIYATRAILRVDTVWKGPVISEVAVLGGEHSASCAMVFEEGQTLVVFASDNDDMSMMTTICDGTGMVQRSETVAAFGAGTSVPEGAPQHESITGGSAPVGEPDRAPWDDLRLGTLVVVAALLLVLRRVVIARRGGTP